MLSNNAGETINLIFKNRSGDSISMRRGSEQQRDLEGWGLGDSQTARGKGRSSPAEASDGQLPPLRSLCLDLSRSPQLGWQLLNMSNNDSALFPAGAASEWGRCGSLRGRGEREKEEGAI